MRVCYVTGKGENNLSMQERGKEGGKVVALYWPLLSPSFSHIQADKKLERKLKKWDEAFCLWGIFGVFFPSSQRSSRGSLLAHERGK